MTNTFKTPMKKSTGGFANYVKDIVNLMRLDFYRALKDKSVMVVAIVVAAYALFYVFLGFLLSGLPMGAVFTARDAIVASSQLSSMPFLVISILVCIFIGKDLSYGTIRNKIIAGYSKKQIYVGSLLVAWLMAMALLLLFQAVSFGVGAPLIDFPRGLPYPGMQDFWIRLGLGYLLVTLAIAIVVFIEMVSRNMVVALIVSTVVFILGPVLSMLIASFIGQQWGTTSLAYEIFECFFLYDSYLIASGGSMTGLGFYQALESQVAWKTLISSGLSAIALSWLGVYLFHKVDLK